MAKNNKSHSGAKKRFKLTKNGKIKYTKSGHRHLLTKKATKTKRQMRNNIYIDTCDARHIRSLIS